MTAVRSLFLTVLSLAPPAGAQSGRVQTGGGEATRVEAPHAAESDSPAAHEETARVVSIVAAGRADTVALVEARTRALLREYPVIIDWSVRATFRPRDVFEAQGDAPLARIWLDLRDPTRAALYVVDVAHERFLVRVVPLDAGYDEVASESLGTILQSSVEVLLAGATLGVSREAAEEQVSALETPPPKPAPAPARSASRSAAPKPTRTPPSRYQVALEAAYRGQVLSEGPELLQGPELGLSLLQRNARLSVAGFLDVGYRAPLHWDEDGVGARFQGVGVRAGSGVRMGLGSKSSLALLGSVGVDGLEVAPVVSEAATSPRSAFWIATPMVGLHVEGDVLLFGGVSLWGSLGAEVDLMGHHFDVLEGGEPVVVLEAWRVQPVFRVGLRFSP